MATPLQAFVLSFALEGDNIVAQGLRRMTKQADELTDSLGGTDKELKQTEQSSKRTGTEVGKSAQNFMQLARKATAALAPLYALRTVLNQTLDFAKQGEGVLFMAQSANVAADSFQRLANASKMFGGSAEGMAGILANFSGQMQAMKFGENTALQSAAIKYGISLQGANGLATPQEMLENLARRMETLAPEAQLDLGRMVGLDEATIRLLQGGVAGLRKELELADKYQIFSKEDLENSLRFERTMREVKMGMQALWAEIARALLPILQRVGDSAIKVINYFREHSDFIKGGLLAISAILAAIAVKSLIAFAPFFGMAALVAGIAAAFALLYDDFMTWAKGGESALGPMWDKLNSIYDLFQELPEPIQKVFTSFENILFPVQGLWDILSDMPNLLKDILSAAADLVNPFTLIKKGWEGLKSIGGKGNDVDDLVSANPNRITELIGNARAKLEMAEANPLSAINKGDISNAYDNSNREFNVENNFTINGALSPMATSKQVQKDINPLFQMLSGRL